MQHFYYSHPQTTDKTKITGFRKKIKLTQEELATIADVTRQTINTLE
ncbi:helix-turn-helix domain-containing protein [Candidatus Pacearchaeota archaeon]|nr:helix-turn-helix domain-containing protein [Candidatus Pacearchaeota archaeon]